MTDPLIPFWVVIPAAGVGSRMQADRPKQYLPLAGRTLIEHTLDCFLGQPGLRGLVMCMSVDDGWWPDLPCASDERIQRAAGGRDRADSVLSSIDRVVELGGDEADWVLVHDDGGPKRGGSDPHRPMAEP